MSQASKLDGFLIPPGAAVTSLTGDSGGLILPSALNNIDIKGSGCITVVGLGAANKLTITPSVTIPTTFTTTTGNAIPALNTIKILGDANIATSGATDTVSLALATSVTGLTSVKSKTFNTDVATAALNINATTIAGQGSDTDISITLTPKGAGNVILSSAYGASHGATSKVALIDSTGVIAAIAGTTGQALLGGASPAFSTTSYPLTTVKGSLLVATDTNVIGQLASTGLAGQHLTSGGAATVPAWSTTTYADTIAKGALVVATDANQIGSLASTGTAGNLLVSGGAATVPSWTSCTYPTDVAQGDLLYGSAIHVVSALTKDTTATRYLSNTGTNNNPAWAQVDMSNGITGITPVGNGGTGANTLTAYGVLYGNTTSAIGATAAATNGQVLQGVTSGAPTFSTTSYPSTTAKGDVLIASADNVIGVVSGATTAGYVLMANGALTAPTFQALPAAGVISLTGDTGSALTGALKVKGGTNISTAAAGTDITVNISGQVGVGNGGTGASTLTANGVLYGNTTSAIGATAEGGTGMVLIGTTSAAPSFSASPTVTTMYATTFDTNVAAAKLTIAGTTLTATGSNTDVGMTITPKGSGSLTLSTGDLSISSGNLSLIATSSTVGQIKINGVNFAHTYGNSGNIFIGEGSGNFSLNSTYSYGNVCLGYNTGHSLTGSSGTQGGKNTFIGQSAGSACTTGTENVFVGLLSGNSATDATQLTCIGYNSGGSYSSGETSNICIGWGVDGTSGESHVLRIGAGTGTTAGKIDKTVISGITGKTATSGAAVYVNSSNVLGTSTSNRDSKEEIADMGTDSSVIYQLRPRTFKFKADNPKRKQFGMIAEEVEEFFPEMVLYDQDGKPWNLAYQFLAPMLVNEIQKLKTTIDAQATTIAALTARIEALENK